jgi:ligand-binding sensor domain-containing protein
MKLIFFYSFILLVLFSGCEKEPSPVESESLPHNYVSAIYIHTDGTKYFATKKGLAGFDGTKWTVYHSNPKISSLEINDMAHENGINGHELWLGTNSGANVASLPIDALSGATTYTESNTQTLFPEGPGLAGDSVFVVMVDGNNIRWFGTNNGLSAFHGNQFPDINYRTFYNSGFFGSNRITSFDSAGDTLYIGTKGGGVARMVSSNVDAITAASPYEIPWSALPSNNVLSVYTDGAIQWYGTDEGLAKHSGTQAKLNWESYYEEDGLVNNTVQCILKDNQGIMWFGTPEGVSRYDGSTWESFTEADGLTGNNVLCMVADADGSIWFGTDNGVSHLSGTTWTNYKAE